MGINGNYQWHSHEVALRPLYPDRIGIWKYWFLRKGENRSTRRETEQGREPTTNSTHIWRRVRESNPGHIGGRRVLPVMPVKGVQDCNSHLKVRGCFHDTGATFIPVRDENFICQLHKPYLWWCAFYFGNKWIKLKGIQNEQSYRVCMIPVWVVVREWEPRFGTATGVNSHQYVSYQYEIFTRCHVNEYRVTRGNRDDFAPEWKSYRYFVSNPSDGHKGSQDIFQVILHDQWTELYFHRSKTLFFKYLPKRGIYTGDAWYNFSSEIFRYFKCACFPTVFVICRRWNGDLIAITQVFVRKDEKT